MGTLERYILRQMLGPLGFFALVLTGIVWLTQSLRIIDVVINNGQGALVLLEFSALLLPFVLSIVLQLGGLIATVYALHRMIMESEIIAALAGGASRARLARPVIVFGCGLMVLLCFVTIYLMPTSARTLRDRMAEVRGDLAAGLFKDGKFLNPIKGVTVFIREITPEGEMRGLLVQDSREARDSGEAQSVTYTAKGGAIGTSQGGAPVLVMFEGQQLKPEDNGQTIVRTQFRRLVVELEDFFDNTTLRPRKVSERYFWELINPDPAEAKTRKQVGRFKAEGHEQLSAPLYGLALPLIAAAAMLGAAFSRRGMTGTVVIALVLGAGVRVLGIAAKNFTTGAPELWPLMYAIPIAAILGSLFYLTRTGFSSATSSGPTRLGPASGPGGSGGPARNRGRAQLADARGAQRLTSDKSAGRRTR